MEPLNTERDSVLLSLFYIIIIVGNFLLSLIDKLNFKHVYMGTYIWKKNIMYIEFCMIQSSGLQRGSWMHSPSNTGGYCNI